MKKVINYLVAVILTFYFYRTLENFLFLDDIKYEVRFLKLLISSITITVLVQIPLVFIHNRKLLKPYFKKFLAFFPLLFQLVRRDFKSKYKRSVLGVAWTILNPLITMLIMSVVFSTLFRFEIKNFPVYILSGQVIFNFFAEATNMAMSSILGNAGMLKKVNMPKYIFPLSKILSSFINFSFSLIALFLVMFITRFEFTWSMFLLIIPVFYLFIFSLGVGMALSAVTVFFRDITYLYNLFLTTLSYLTPLFYPISIIPDKYRLLISLNPMYHYVECFRTVVLYGGFPTLWQNIVCLAMGVASLAVGLFVFYKKQDRFILYI